MRLHLIYIFYFYNFFKLDYIFTLNIKTLILPLHYRLTLIILNYLNNLGDFGFNCYDVNVALNVLKTILCLR